MDVEAEILKMRERGQSNIENAIKDYDETKKIRMEKKQHVKDTLKKILVEIAGAENDHPAFIEEAAKYGKDGVEAAFALGAFMACHRHQVRSDGDIVVTEAMEETDYERLKETHRLARKIRQSEEMIRKMAATGFLRSSDDAMPETPEPKTLAKGNEPAMFQ